MLRGQIFADGIPEINSGPQLADTVIAWERRLIAHARELIAASRHALADDPLRARELAIRAREAMSAIYPLYGKKPDHGPARRILQGANVRPA